MTDSSSTQETLSRKSPQSTPRQSHKVTEVPNDKIKLTLTNKLIQAILAGHLEKIQRLLDRGVQINSKNDYGFGALVAALYIEDEKRRSRVFRFLLDSGASYKTRDEHNDRSVLLWACVLGRNDQVRVLLDEAGGDISLMDKDNGGSTALHHAVLSGNLPLVELLTHYHVRFGVSVDVEDSRGFTSYLLARRLGYRDIADYLNRKGLASVGHSDFLFRSPREWSQIGKNERKKAVAVCIKDKINASKVQGRPIQFKKSESLMEELYTDSVGALHSLQNYDQLFKQSYFNVNKCEVQRSMSEKPFSISMNTRSLVTNQLGKITLSDRSITTTDSKKAEMPSNGIALRANYPIKYEQPTWQVKTSDALSLLEQSSSTKGRAVSHFHPSELDVNKVVEYKHMLGNIGIIMNMLAEQTTKSYRKSVKVGKPEVPAEVSPTLKKNVSTFAALFGSKTGTPRKGTPRKATIEKTKQKNSLLTVRKTKD